MSYMWKEFNIKTFPAETVVFRDGALCPELSTLTSTDIDKKYDVPVHIIYVGEIAGENELNINIIASFQPVFLSVDVASKTPAKLNIFVKNAGTESSMRAHVLLKNENRLDFNCTARHMAHNTEILVKTKLVADRNSLSKLSGTAVIDTGIKDAVSDINFSAIADKTARIEFLPAQRISSAPKSADHSASLYTPTDAQILYLRQAGLSGAEVTDVMRQAFMNDFNLF